MPINPVAHYQQVLSTALEDRSSGYQDLVSKGNALLALMNRKGLWQPYSGPRIRETLRINKPSGQWYSGYDFLANAPVELFNDAYFTPKMVAVPITLSYEEILNNEGENQIIDIMTAYMEAAEDSLEDEMDEAIHGDGTADGGKQMGGLKLAIPTVEDAGTYGGISRADNALWRTTTFDADTDFPTIGTQVSSTTIRPMLNTIMTQRSRGRRGADLLLMSPEHYAAYDAATIAIQRVTSSDGALGKFATLRYYGAGRSIEIVQDGGIGSNMPANTTYGIDTDSLRIRYNPNRNFDKLFAGEGMKPINQDAIVQYIGWMGELTMVNPLFNWKLYDSDTAS